VKGKEKRGSDECNSHPSGKTSSTLRARWTPWVWQGVLRPHAQLARGFSGAASPDGDLHGHAGSEGSNRPSGEASSRRVPEPQRGAELQDDVSALRVGDGAVSCSACCVLTQGFVSRGEVEQALSAVARRRRPWFLPAVRASTACHVLGTHNGVSGSSPGVGFLLLCAPARRLQDGEGSVRATPWAGGEASARRAPSIRAARSSSSGPQRRSSSSLVAAAWEGGAGAGLGHLYAAQQPRVRALAANDRDGAAAWRGDAEGIQQCQRIGKGSG
jgi:hypothetical protein